MTNETTAALLVTPRDAAKILAIGERTLWQLTHDGAIPCVKIGAPCVRYAVTDLQQWVEQQRQRTKAQAALS
jgi:excisionase family DNA binding protein